jgi:hypothetical protein
MAYQPVLDKLADDIADIEDVVLDRPDPATLAQIFSLKRKLVEFRRVAAGMREVVNSLTRREKGLLGDDLDVYFRDIYDHIFRDRRTDRDLSRPALRRARYLSLRRRQSHQRSDEGAHHLGHRRSSTRHHHGILRHESKAALDREPAWHSVCGGSDGPLYSCGSALLQKEEMVLGLAVRADASRGLLKVPNYLQSVVL